MTLPLSWDFLDIRSPGRASRLEALLAVGRRQGSELQHSFIKLQRLSLKPQELKGSEPAGGLEGVLPFMIRNMTL